MKATQLKYISTIYIYTAHYTVNLLLKGFIAIIFFGVEVLLKNEVERSKRSGKFKMLLWIERRLSFYTIVVRELDNKQLMCSCSTNEQGSSVTEA